MTKICDKNIPVYFTTREIYKGQATLSKFMGNISYMDMIQIIVALENYTPKENACTHELGARYTANLTSDTDIYTRHRFKLFDSFWGYNKAFPLCNPTVCVKSTYPLDSNKMFWCARNLREGRCRDKFMRETIGAVLFPQFYANEKQK